MVRILNLLLLIVVLSSCKEKDTTITIWVYQTKFDYSKNVAVELSPDKTKITSAPTGTISTQPPVKLIDNYLLNGSYGPNTGYTSMTIDEYNKYAIKPGVYTLDSLLIDKDPYISFYERVDENSRFINGKGAFGIDTAFINYLISKGELKNYFNKLK